MGLFKDFDKVNYQEWYDKIIVDLKGKDYEETLVWNSEEGIKVQPFYNSSIFANNTSFVSTPIKKSDNWKIREIIQINSIKEANLNAINALKGGANSLLFIGEVNNKEELNELLQDVETAIIDVHFYNPELSHISKLIHPKNFVVSYDFLGEIFTTGRWYSNKENDINELASVITQNKSLKTITVKGTNFCNSGATLIQELAFSLNQAVEYFNLLTDKGIGVNQLANKIQFNFGIKTNYFFEIAKLRAARLLWKMILKKYQVGESENMFIHSETSDSNITKEDSHLNILRTTSEAMSAIIGGCDSLSILPYDKTVDFSKRIARNIQLILKEEAFLDKVKNPADGSYYIEQLTDEIAEKTWLLFKEVEQKGGFLACVENNFIKAQIGKTD